MKSFTDIFENSDHKKRQAHVMQAIEEESKPDTNQIPDPESQPIPVKVPGKRFNSTPFEYTEDTNDSSLANKDLENNQPSLQRTAKEEPALSTQVPQSDSDSEKKELTPEEKAQREKKLLKSDVLFLLTKIGLVLALVYVMFFIIFGIARMSDQSMFPALKDGDLCLYYRLYDDLEAGDVVIVDKNGEETIRRIIAMPGDKVTIGDHGLEINGYVQQEAQIYTNTLAYKEGIEFPITLGEGEYFVLADMRPNAKDSRIYGPVTKDDIKGIVMSVLRRRGI